MATPAKALRKFESFEPRERSGLVAIPNPENVRVRAAEIRRGWTPSERRHRAQLAHYLLWRNLLGESE
jgi:hypothetical protein